MNPTTDGKQARVLAAAIRNWATIDHDPSPTTARIQIRQPPEWQYAGTINITEQQVNRLLSLLRHDLAEQNPGLSSPDRAAAVIHALLTERRTAGHTTIHVRDLVDAAPRIGRPAAWVAAHLNHLVDTGQIEETWRPSVFRIA